MKYLLDVNVLVALCVSEHEFHERVASWMNEAARAGRSELITCAVTELGFLRTLAQAEPYGFTIEQGKDLLSQLKSSKEFHFVFLSDGLGLAQLQRWVRGPSRSRMAICWGWQRHKEPKWQLWMNAFLAR